MPYFIFYKVKNKEIFIMQIVEPIREKNKIELVKQILFKKKIKRDFLLFLIGINSGLRISDILNLKVSDVKNKQYIEIIEKKTKKYKRFPITRSFKSELENYIKGKKDSQWLFQSQKSCKPLTRVQAYRIIKTACQKAKINCNIGTHTLRKTFGYHFYKEKKDIALLQCIFNHSSPSITMRYIGINQDIIDENLKSFSL